MKEKSLIKARFLTLIFILILSVKGVGQYITCFEDLDSSCTQLKLKICTSYMFGPPAPKFDGYTVTNKADNLTLEVYYKMPGVAGAFASGRVDTINYTIPYYAQSLKVRINTVYNGTVYATNSSSYIPLCYVNGLQQTDPDPEVIKIFPNPVKDKLHIQTNRSAEIKSYSIIDASGKQILTAPYLTNDINISAIPQGVYFIKLEVADEIIVRRFVKLE